MNCRELLQFSTLLLAFLLAGCSHKEKLRGQREELLVSEQEYGVIHGSDETPVVVEAAMSHGEFPQPYLNGEHNYAPHKFSLNPRNIWTSGLDFEANDVLKITASTIVAEGKVFCMDGAGIVYAFDRKTGKKIWRMSSTIVGKDGQTGCAMAYDEGRLIVSTSFSECFSFDAKTGKIQWRVKLPTVCKGDGITIYDGKAFLMCSNSSLNVLDIRSGKILWSHSGMVADVTVLGSSSVCVKDDVVYLAYPSGEVYALMAGSGAVIWDAMLSKFSLTNAAHALTHPRACPVIKDGIVYFVSASEQTTAFDARTGKRLWCNDFGGLQTPIVSGNSIFVFNSRSELVCMNRYTGKLRWRKKLEKSQEAESWYGQILINNHILTLSPSGKMSFVSVFDGKIEKTMDIGGKFSTNPVIADGIMYMLTNGGSIAAYR